ncbi:hypothetical protein PVK06_045431 [Gossypium arboreum]|uniref:Uncharacterized protein n=1 Tax=Gossypium arboreum TaxID=29729 RepID=A0ABR0MU15_GOSAR|nr:hypothetical protein PVK06_045431 [Gossypium arboreum]
MPIPRLFCMPLETVQHLAKFCPWEVEATKKWEKPPKGVIKINFNVTVKENRMGYGVIIRDDDGFVLGGGGGFSDDRVSVQEAECITRKAWKLRASLIFMVM